MSLLKRNFWQKGNKFTATQTTFKKGENYVTSIRKQRTLGKI